MTYYNPSQVNVYIIDCGNMTLKSFETSNIVGGVALTAEEEKVINLFKMLFRTMEERKKVFSEKGLGTHRAYLEAGYTDMPQIILMIDNMAAFKEYYERLSDDFLALSRESNSLGISIVATATQTNAMNYKALSNYGTRIAFVCNDSNEYMNLFDRCRMEPKDTVGRALCVIDKRILEFQTALCVDGDKEYLRVENIKKLINKTNENFGDIKAQPIPFVPETIVKSEVDKKMYLTPYKFPVGIDFNSVKYTYIDLLSVGYFGITGKAKSGKTNFVKGILDAIQDDIFNNLTRAFLLDDGNMSFDSCGEYGYVEQYELDEVMVDSIVDTLHEEMTSRLNTIKNNRDVSREVLLKEEPLMLLVVENRKIIEYISKNTDILRKFKEILENAANSKMCVIFSNVENVAVGFNAPELYKVIKNNKKMFVFEDASEFKFVDISVKQQKDNSKTLKLGDVFMCFGNKFDRIRTILND